MNRTRGLSVLAVAALLLGAGCGESEEEKRQKAAAQKRAQAQQAKQEAAERRQAEEDARKEREADARKVVNTFIKAANGGDGNRACKQVDAKFKRKLGADRCPQAVVQPGVVPENAKIQLLVVSKNSGFALIQGSGGGKSTRATLRYKGGQWRITG
jgi:hypothetical protein